MATPALKVARKRRLARHLEVDLAELLEHALDEAHAPRARAGPRRGPRTPRRRSGRWCRTGAGAGAAGRPAWPARGRPTGWPKRSLTDLKWSRSIITQAKCREPSRAFCACRACARSMRAVCGVAAASGRRGSGGSSGTARAPGARPPRRGARAARWAWSGDRRRPTCALRNRDCIWLSVVRKSTGRVACRSSWRR